MGKLLILPHSSKLPRILAVLDIKRVSKMASDEKDSAVIDEERKDIDSEKESEAGLFTLESILLKPLPQFSSL